MSHKGQMPLIYEGFAQMKGRKPHPILKTEEINKTAIKCFIYLPVKDKMADRISTGGYRGTCI